MEQMAIICERPDYLVEFQGKTSCIDGVIIRGLKISRPGFGKLQFLADVKVFENLSVDDIVFIDHKEVTLYPNENEENIQTPPIGKGLNCAAEISLERVWQTKNDCSRREFEDKLKQIIESQGAEFCSYNAVSGLLKFTVKHFSKYSCNVEEDEDEVEQIDSSSSDIIGKSNHRLPKQAGLGGVSVDELKKQEEMCKKPLLTQQPVSEVTSKVDYVSLENSEDQPKLLASQGIFKPISHSNRGGDNIHIGDGDGLRSIFNMEKRLLADKKIENPLHNSTPANLLGASQFQNMSNPIMSPFATAPRAIPPHDAFSLSSRHLNDTPVMKSVKSLRSHMMHKISQEEEQSDKDIFEETHPTPPKKTKPQSYCSTTGPLPSVETSRIAVVLQELSNSLFPSSPIKHSATDTDVNFSKYSAVPQAPPSVPSNTATWPVQHEVQISDVGKPDFEDLFTTIRPKAKTTQCKLYGAPRVCFSKSGHFITVENLQTSHGFQGKAKISTFKSYSEKQEIIPLSDPYRNVLVNEMMLQLKKFGRVLFKEYANIIKEEMSKTQVPNHFQCLKSELIIWELCDILWPEEVTNPDQVRDDGFLLGQHRRLCQWMVDNGSFVFGRTADTENRSVFGLLMKGRIEDAVEQAISEGNDLMAVVLASRMNFVDFTDFEEVFQFFPENSLNILNLCNGSLALTELTEDNVSNMWSGDWLQYFSLYLLYYGSSKTLAVDVAVQNFEAMMREIARDSEAVLPKFECSSVATICIHLLKLHSCTGYPVKKLLSPEIWTNDILDYKLSWLLMMNLEVIGYIPENEVYSSVTLSFAGQLEAIELFEWAVFVLQCHNVPEAEDDSIFKKAMQATDLHKLRLLELNLENGHQNLKTEVFLKTDLGVDKRLLFTIKGRKAAASLRHDQMIGYFRKAGNYQKAFDTLKTYLDVYGLDIVKEYNASVYKHLLSLYAFHQNICGWEVHGELMFNYFRISRDKKYLALTTTTSLAECSSSANDDENIESSVLGFLKSITKYNPQNERQRAFLLHLTLSAQKAVEMLLADTNVDSCTKDRIKDGLIAFLDTAVPSDYFQCFRCFIHNVLLL